MPHTPDPRPVMLGPACDPEAVADQLLSLAWGEDGIRDADEALRFIAEARQWMTLAHAPHCTR